jgi:tRNA A-37 threonylcarbamoyl transferase component Bud32
VREEAVTERVAPKPRETESVRESESVRERCRHEEAKRQQARSARNGRDVKHKADVVGSFANPFACNDGVDRVLVGRLTVYTASVLGEGSGGTKVYKGLHSDGRTVAVKVIDTKVVPVHRARREMQLLQRLAESTGRGRDHVIAYRCIEEREDVVLLGMELCECSLHDVISVQQQRVPRAHQIRIVKELSEAVAFLHEHQIVHRDIRPQNCLFKEGGFTGAVKLTDFGLSTEMETGDLDASFSTTTVNSGTEIGSFGYYAPEVYRHEKITAKVDAFSLGCCIFYVLSHGRRPFEDPQDPQNKYMLKANTLTGNCNLAPLARLELPEAVALVTSLIDREPKVRPSMTQVLEHVFFWSDEHSFQFLCAVGKEGDINSAIARGFLPPSLMPQRGWRSVLAETVWAYYTRGRARKYDIGSTTHLLRFLRNADAHPPAGDSAVQAVFKAHGGMARYFTSVCFPELALQVWTALMDNDDWNTRSGLSRYLQTQTSHADKSGSKLCTGT